MKIYNTLTRKKEEFVPIREGEVSIYVKKRPKHEDDGTIMIVETNETD